MKLLLMLALLIMPSLCMACSCYYDRDMKDVADNSSVIFLGAVTSIGIIGDSKDKNKQGHLVSVTPEKVFKGKASSVYNFKSRPRTVNFDGQEIILVAGCHLDVELGEKYVVLYESNKEIGWSWCSENILPTETNKFDYFMENIRENL